MQLETHLFPKGDSNEGAVIISSNLPVGFVPHNTVTHLGPAAETMSISCVLIVLDGNKLFKMFKKNKHLFCNECNIITF